MAYLLDPNVQIRLAEVGHIPSVLSTQPRDPLVRQAMEAFSYGVPYPINVDESVINLYWKELDLAIRKVFVSGISPSDALKAASNDLVSLLRNLESSP
jgi:predicted alpha/beta-hydrolase family hydrolase